MKFGDGGDHVAEYDQLLARADASATARDWASAMACLEAASRLRPGAAQPWLRLADVARLHMDLDRVEAACAQALARGAAAHEVWMRRATLELARGRLDEAQAAAELALEAAPHRDDAGGVWLTVLHYQPHLGGADLAQAARWLKDRGRRPDNEARRVASPITPRKRLRVGYVSPDFRSHSVWWFFAPLLRAHDRGEFEWFGYFTGSWKDAITERAKAGFDRWRELAALDDDAAAARIAADEVDVLIDLSGRFGEARPGIFARRPARAQAHYLGYCGRTGQAGIDHFISDERVDPHSEDAWAEEAGERVARVEDGGGWHAFDPGETAPVAEHGPWRERGVVTFGSFNAWPKVNLAVRECWAELLGASPGTRLLLRAESFAHEPTRREAAAFFQARGLGPDRVETRAPVASRRVHFEHYADIDVTLDPFPYNGVTTTCDALWQGVPVAGVRGTRHSGRIGEGLLAAAGLADEWLFADPAALVRGLAARIRNPDTLPDRAALAARFRAAQKKRAPELARALEGIYRRLAGDHRAGAAI